ncbi:MAG TPA: hypothetical protein VF666_03945 [Pyrinomonadaceae bacterium]|jgi:hypothetical protein
MRRAFSIFTLLLLWFAFVSGVQGSGVANARRVGQQPHMKGYELYSWQTGGEWYFSLLPGTNRLKTHAEVTSRKARMRGIAALKRSLRRLPEGGEVFWTTRGMPRMSLPPRAVLDEMSVYCRERGITLRH